MGDGYLSLKTETPRLVHTNTEIHIDIKGMTRFRAETPKGRHTLALYANIALPQPGTEARRALTRGGWRAWFQQGPVGKPDITGLLGPIPVAEFGHRHLLISHSWPHTVSALPWEFCISLWAYDAMGKPVDLPLRLLTREVKIIADKATA